MLRLAIKRYAATLQSEMGSYSRKSPPPQHTNTHARTHSLACSHTPRPLPMHTHVHAHTCTRVSLSAGSWKDPKQRGSFHPCANLSTCSGGQCSGRRQRGPGAECPGAPHGRPHYPCHSAPPQHHPQRTVYCRRAGTVQGPQVLLIGTAGDVASPHAWHHPCQSRSCASASPCACTDRLHLLLHAHGVAGLNALLSDETGWPVWWCRTKQRHAMQLLPAGRLCT